jgi:hypothetical protein
MPDKLTQIAELLLKKTNAGEIKWETTPQPNMFQTSFPNFSVLIHDRPPLALRIYDEKGQALEEMSEIQAIQFGFVRMRELFVAARRGALNVEEALDQLLKTLVRGRP